MNFKHRNVLVLFASAALVSCGFQSSHMDVTALSEVDPSAEILVSYYDQTKKLGLSSETSFGVLDSGFWYLDRDLDIEGEQATPKLGVVRRNDACFIGDPLKVCDVLSHAMELYNEEAAGGAHEYGTLLSCDYDQKVQSVVFGYHLFTDYQTFKIVVANQYLEKCTDEQATEDATFIFSIHWDEELEVYRVAINVKEYWLQNGYLIDSYSAEQREALAEILEDASLHESETSIYEYAGNLDEVSEIKGLLIELGLEYDEMFQVFMETSM